MAVSKAVLGTQSLMGKVILVRLKLPVRIFLPMSSNGVIVKQGYLEHFLDHASGPGDHFPVEADLSSLGMGS